MKVKRFVSDLDRIMSLIYDDVPLPPREVRPREFPAWEERAREASSLSAGRGELPYKTRRQERRGELQNKKSRRERMEELPSKQSFRTKPAKPEIRIDMGALSGIREDAEYTMGKLMTEEERYGFADMETDQLSAPSKREPEIVCSAAVLSGGETSFENSKKPAPFENQGASENPSSLEEEPALFGLDALEYRILNCLLTGRSLSEIDLKGKILSVLIDGINEKLFDEIGDLVIENESSPVLIEDYRNELMEMFAK